MSIGNVRSMVFTAFYVALICVCAIIRLDLPFTPIPVTMQLFAVFLASAIQDRKNAVLTVVVYIMLGATGLPVFSGFRGGIGVLAGSSGGFISGFLAGALIISTLAAYCEKIWQYVLSIAAGMIAVYALGIIQFMLVTNTGLVAAISAAILPFVLPDLAKIGLAAVTVKYLTPSVLRNR